MLKNIEEKYLRFCRKYEKEEIIKVFVFKWIRYAAAVGKRGSGFSVFCKDGNRDSGC